MPAAIPFIIEAAGAYLGASAVTVAVVTIAASIAVSSYERRRQEQKARDAYNDSLQDRNITIRSAISPREYILGQRRTGGTLLYAESLGPKKEYLDTVTAFSANKCDLIGYYLGDEFVTQGGVLNTKYGRTTLTAVTDVKSVTTSNGIANIDLTSPPANSNLPAQYLPTLLQSVAAVAKQGSSNYPLAITGLSGNTLSVSGLPNGTSQVTINYNTFLYQAINLLYNDGDPNQLALQFSAQPGIDFNAKWTTNHRLRGVAHSRVIFSYDETAYFSGAPSVGAVLRGGPADGAPFVDTRNNSNPAYTDNPALLAYWYMTLPRKQGGCGIPATWIDTASVNTAANICDELITVKKLDNTGTEQIKRYQCHTIISTDAPPLQNLDIILTAMAGKRVFTAGKYKLFAGAFRSAIATLTDSDVIGDRPINADPSGSDDTPANIVSAKFLDAAKDYIESSPVQIRNASLIASDGYEEPLDISLPATTDARQANYLMGVALQQARPAYTISLSVGGIAENLAVGDCVQLNLVNRASYSGRTLEIVGYKDNFDGTFDLVLSEIKATTWALDLNTFTPINQPVLPDISYLWQVMPLMNFSAVPISVQTLRDGSTLARVRITWSAITDPFVLSSGKVEFRYKDALDATAQYITIGSARPDDTSITIDANLVDGNVYQFEGRVVNGVGAASYWVLDYDLFSGNRVDTKYIARGNCRATDLSFRKISGVNNWDSDIYSIDGYSSCHLQFKPGDLFSLFMMGLSSNPEASQSFENLDVAWYCDGSANDGVATLKIYESGTFIADIGPYLPGTELGIAYDGSTVNYYKDRVLTRTKTGFTGQKTRLDSSFWAVGSIANSIIFGPGPDFEDFVVGTREIGPNAATVVYQLDNLNASGIGGGANDGTIFGKINIPDVTEDTLFLGTYTGKLSCANFANGTAGTVCAYQHSTNNGGLTQSVLIGANNSTYFSSTFSFTITKGTTGFFFFLNVNSNSSTGGQSGAVNQASFKVEMIKR